MDQLVGEPEVSSMIFAGRWKLHYTYPNGSEMIEEYDQTSNDLLIRKVKIKWEFGISDWIYEVGQEETKFDPETSTLKLSSTSPIFLRLDSKTRFEWWIWNMPWPKENYQLSIDHDKQQIVLRTANKKYYKRIDIPELKKYGLALDEKCISWKY